jgi:T-complex protein 1 subunit alpha
MSAASQQMKKSVTNAKIACIDFNLNKFRMALGITVQCEDVSKLAEVRQREMDITKERIQKIIDAGANVIITTKGIDDFAQKFLVEKGVIGIRRVEKNDMRKIAKLTGAELVHNIVDEDGNETFDAKLLGEAKNVYEKVIGDNC